MNQISTYAIPAVQTGISKKPEAISWMSDENDRGKSSLGSSNIRFSNNLKRRK